MSWAKRTPASISFAVLTMMMLAGTRVSAQQLPRSWRAAPVEDREAAAEAFDRGTRAHLARDFTSAAEWFETAYRLAPAPQAMIQAIRARERSGDSVRAATLALRLMAEQSHEPEARAEAERVLNEHAPNLVQVNVGCGAPCEVELDRTVLSFPAFFVQPDTEHVVRVTFEDGAYEQQWLDPTPAGQRLDMQFDPVRDFDFADAAEFDPEIGVVETEARAPVPAPEPPPNSEISIAFPLVAGGLTLVSAAVLTWSIVDMYDGVAAYESEPTRPRFDDGRTREIRTGALIGVTSALLVTTVVLAILADWDGAPNTDSSASTMSVTDTRGDELELSSHRSSGLELSIVDFEASQFGGAVLLRGRF